MKEDKSLGQKIALIAKEKFGSQKKMANVLNIAPSTVSDWISGRITPSLSIIKKLCLTADISLDWLVLGKTFEQQAINLDLFNQVFAIAYNFSLQNKMNLDGNYFLACYDFIAQEKKKNPDESIEDIFCRLKPIIKRLRIT